MLLEFYPQTIKIKKNKEKQNRTCELKIEVRGSVFAQHAQGPRGREREWGVGEVKGQK